MTQAQMTVYLADKIGITKRQAKSALDELNQLVIRQLKKEGSLRLAGLGVFRKRKLAARKGSQSRGRRADQNSRKNPPPFYAGKSIEGIGTRRPISPVQVPPLVTR